MTEVGRRLLEELVYKAFAKGDLHCDGERLVLANGQAVTPQLAFEVVTAVEVSATSAGVRLGVSEDDEEHEMGVKFAELRQEVLVASDPQVAERQERAQRAALRLAAERRRIAERVQWPKNVAPLLEPRLVRREA